MDEDFLIQKLQERSKTGALRSLKLPDGQIDYYSNDYLGIATLRRIDEALRGKFLEHGSTGSRLLAGNYPLIVETENLIAGFHGADAALIFNSGYDANFGLLSCIAQRGDLLIFDKLSHASIRDGVRQSFADSCSFIHNDTEDLEKKLKLHTAGGSRKCFVVTESVFSMDGDIAPLSAMVSLCEKYGSYFIVDEAHATGIVGEQGEGVLQSMDLHKRCFARIHTFGKALGCHGAVILGSKSLREYLINFCRPFIYSTAIPQAAVSAIQAVYKIFPDMHQEREQLKNLISLFDRPGFSQSITPIQCYIIPGNDKVKEAAATLKKNNFDVRPILYPTVPLGEERLRIALHSFNSMEDTERLISVLSDKT